MIPRVYPDPVQFLRWNSQDGTLDVEMGLDGVTQQVGLEQYMVVRNNTGSTILNGKVVGFAGSSSGRVAGAYYLADGSQPSLYFIGVATMDIPTGTEGYVTTYGYVRDVDTSAFSVGDILYADPNTAGGMTNVKPTAPDNVIVVAAVLVSDATTGVIMVRPTINQMQYYGHFSKTDSQTPAATNTAYTITLTTTDISNGVVIGSPASRIVVPESGLYSVSATIQVSSNNSSAKNIWFWFRKNGTDIANSARIVTSDVNNGYIPISLKDTVSLNANEYIELVYAANNTGISISSVASTAFAPAAPAVQLEVVQAQQ